MTARPRPLAWRAALPALALGACTTIPPASPEQAALWQGVYAGEAVINDPALPANLCTGRIAMRDFQVIGNQVKFGLFTGTIRENASVELVEGRISIYGGFEPNAFVGTLQLPPYPYCSYRVVLNRVAG